jgi:hypothetical protein
VAAGFAGGLVLCMALPGQREVQIEIDHICSLAGRHVNVYIGGAKVGAARVNSRGVAELTGAWFDGRAGGYHSV